MECTIKWVDGMSFIAETGTGHLVAMDGAPEAGGRNLAPRPMELMLAGAGGCTAFDVVLILKRGRHDVRGCSVRLEAERADADPKVFTRIRFIYTVTGRNLKRETVERANPPLGGKVRLGLDLAWHDGRDHTRVRNHRSRLSVMRARGSPPRPPRNPSPFRCDRSASSSPSTPASSPP